MGELEKRIIGTLQAGLPLESRPYQKISQKLGITEELLLEKIKELQTRGYLRRFGATLNPPKAGLRVGGMAIWKVPEQDCEKVGGIMSSFPEVSHCYQRPPFDEGHNLFTMIHGRDRDDCERIARRISEATGIEAYRILFTEEEFKKSTFRYFTDKG
ncbi:MAG: Lrp/AsnC family transcriptional regulator [Deltaproteobacteria bacterium]|nr:MAG: Lrp/AsnC family transcriptional regulator [Deltaproteobacteria bacterium]